MHPTVPSPFSSGRIMGIDTHSFTVRNRETRQTERRKMLCAVIINYRVKVLIPETEVWYPGQERPPYVLRNMSGAETDYIILDVDREGGVAIGSRRMALAAQRHFFDTIKGGRSHWREADLPRSGCGPQAVPGGVWRQGYEPKPEGPHLHRYT